ncbi:MAG: Glu/Leu/Phe/Val dehydrogenase [Bdellovibrionales bacterium]|nr:Glu/Leu/Phe/Val dehydrogenase [Bdellovibrionales bacterium]
MAQIIPCTDLKLVSEVEKRGHEQVTVFYYPQVGLKALVAIHNTVLGPSLGGCRMRIYTDETQALDDVLRLSEGMTYKSSIAGLDLGGGKSCILADPALDNGRRELFLQFAECLNHLNGRYITAEDMGTCVEDVMTMREVTKYAAGFAREKGGSGDPSPWTARGVFNSIQAACERKFGSADLSKRSVSLEGVGHVGMILLKMLREAGATVTVSDIHEQRLDEAHTKYGAECVGIEAIYDVDCDIYSPCAIGQTVNGETLKRLKCSIIAGGANNQLINSSVYETIESRNILYCPDFVINAGGVISVGGEYVEGGWSETWVTNKVKNISSTVHRILDEAEKRSKFPEVVAIELAKERIRETQEKKGGLRS